MARFDVHAMTGQRSFFLLDVQADLLDRLDTRVVVPLFPEKEAPPPIATLNPVFDIQGQRHVMSPSPSPPCGGGIWARSFSPWMTSISGS